MIVRGNIKVPRTVSITLLAMRGMSADELLPAERALFSGGSVSSLDWGLGGVKLRS
jgi:hypothetical protein